MSKSINGAQSEMLLEKMLQKPDIAKGFVKENREKVAEFWKELTLALNSIGPPVKSEFEWKKVWSDQKRYVRKKASQNKIYERGTGGGPNKTQKLSAAEEAIYQLLDMKASIDGVENSQCYGLPAKRPKVDSNVEVLAEIVIQDEEEVPACSTAFRTNIRDIEISTPECQSECSPTDSSTQPAPQSSLNTSIGMKSKKPTNSELVLKELETQQELCCKLGEILKEIKSNNKEMEYWTKKIYRIQERICDQKEKKLSEMMRHNYEMEKLRKIELEELLENNRRTLELKEIKLELLRKGRSQE